MLKNAESQCMKKWSIALTTIWFRLMLSLFFLYIKTFRGVHCTTQICNAVVLSFPIGVYKTILVRIPEARFIRLYIWVKDNIQCNVVGNPDEFMEM